MIKNKEQQKVLENNNSGSSVSRIHALDMAKIIGENLKAKRIALNLTQTDLGNLVNISYQQIQKYESGKSLISAVLLYDVSLHLNTPVSNFYQGLEIRKSNDAGILNQKNTTLSTREISEVIVSFSLIEDKKIRQSLIKTITCIGQSGQDD